MRNGFKITLGGVSIENLTIDSYTRNGAIEHSYASGQPDSGIYVGQCGDCNTVIDAVTAENNAIGSYRTNASGNVYVVRSTFKGNRLRIAPNSQRQELLSPQRDTYVVGIVVIDNDNPDTPPAWVLTVVASRWAAESPT